MQTRRHEQRTSGIKRHEQRYQWRPREPHQKLDHHDSVADIDTSASDTHVVDAKKDVNNQYFQWQPRQIQDSKTMPPTEQIFGRSYEAGDQLEPRSQHIPRKTDTQAGPAPILVKATMPWSAQRLQRQLTQIMNKMTPANYRFLKFELARFVTSPSTLEDFTVCIYEKVVSELKLPQVYARLFSDLDEILPSFPSDKDDRKEIKFKRILINCCQMTFESYEYVRAEARKLSQETEAADIEKLVKLRFTNNIRLICELFKKKMLPEKIIHHIIQELLSQNCPTEEKVEFSLEVFASLCQYLDGSPKSRRFNDIYFAKLEELESTIDLTPHLRSMIKNTIHQRQQLLMKNLSSFHHKMPSKEQALGNAYEVEDQFKPTFQHISLKINSSVTLADLENSMLQKSQGQPGQIQASETTYNQPVDDVQNSLQTHTAVGPAPILIKATMPWSARRIKRQVEYILDKITPANYIFFKFQLANLVTSPCTLEDFTMCIYEKVVSELKLPQVYAQLFSDLDEILPSFPSDEDDRKEIKFKRILINCCQMTFESYDDMRAETRKPSQETEAADIEILVKLRFFNNIRLMCELFKKEMLSEKLIRHILQELLSQNCPTEERVEFSLEVFASLCQHLDGSPKSRRSNDIYFAKLEELESTIDLTPRLRSMITKTINQHQQLLMTNLSSFYHKMPPKEQALGKAYEVEDQFEPTFQHISSKTNSSVTLADLDNLMTQKSLGQPGQIQASGTTCNRPVDDIRNSLQTHIAVDRTRIFIKATMPWSDPRIKRQVPCILDKITPANYIFLKFQLAHLVTSPCTLEHFTMCIYEKVVSELKLPEVYAQLFSDLDEILPSFPSDEDDRKVIKFKRILINCCQMTFESYDDMRAETRKPSQETEAADIEKLVKLRFVNNIRLMCELFKKKMLPEKIIHHIIQELFSQNYPTEEKVEFGLEMLASLCQCLDGSPKSRRLSDIYFTKLAELECTIDLAPHLRSMIKNTINHREQLLMKNLLNFQHKDMLI